MKIKNIGQVLLAIIICELAGMIGAIFTVSATPTWYAGIAKPTFSPPNWIFAPVWTTLFALMGIAAYLVYKKGIGKKVVKVALGIFAIQLILNIKWSLIFFGMHNPGHAFIEIIFLWLAILLTIIAFSKVSKSAAYLLIPYILWVSFASFLNFSIWQLNSQTTTPVACTMEAKLCPDGSSVGRSGPKCEFTPCPEINYTWKKLTDSKQGVSFTYPESLLTTYIHPVDWPPQVNILNETYSCTEGGTEIARAGQTSKRLVNNREYCVTKESEGAAGSTYTNYAYAFPKDTKTIIFTFTTRATQCANYDEPNKTACEKEREAFDLDGVVDKMAQSLYFGD